MTALVKGRLERVQRAILTALGLRLDADEEFLDVEFLIGRLDKITAAEIRRLLELEGYDQGLTKSAAAVATANAVAVTELTGIKGLARFTPDRVSAWRKENTDLIVSLCKDQVSDLRTSILERTQGLRVEQIRSLIRERFSVSESRADLIARDQTLKLNAQMTRENYKRANVSRYVWTTTRDERVRDAHAELDGKVFSFDEPPEPGNPGEDFQCRCVAFPVFDGANDDE
jgi:SPP1 gp7 family putative phage head morphogenesis protein